MVEEAFSRDYVGRKLGLELLSNGGTVGDINRALVDRTIVELFGAKYDPETKRDLRLEESQKEPQDSEVCYLEIFLNLFRGNNDKGNDYEKTEVQPNKKISGFTREDICHILKGQGVKLVYESDLREPISFEAFINDTYFPSSEGLFEGNNRSSGFYKWTSRQCQDGQTRYFLLFIEGIKSFDDEDSLDGIIPRNRSEKRPYIKPEIIID